MLGFAGEYDGEAERYQSAKLMLVPPPRGTEGSYYSIKIVTEGQKG